MFINEVSSFLAYTFSSAFKNSTA